MATNDNNNNDSTQRMTGAADLLVKRMVHDIRMIANDRP